MGNFFIKSAVKEMVNDPEIMFKGYFAEGRADLKGYFEVAREDAKGYFAEGRADLKGYFGVARQDAKDYFTVFIAVIVAIAAAFYKRPLPPPPPPTVFLPPPLGGLEGGPHGLQYILLQADPSTLRVVQFVPPQWTSL